jgi:GTP-binding protein
VGRPNVGKSTLFNRLTGSRRSIVGDEPGITRDRIYGECEWAGRQYRVVDTGGIVPDDAELIPTEIYNQAKVALEEADALVLVVDVRTELASPDYDLARLLIRGGKPVFLAVNKVEGAGLAAEAENLRRLGIKELYPISSEHGQGIGDLLDAIAAALPEDAKAVKTIPTGPHPHWRPPRTAMAKPAKRARSCIGRMGSLSSMRLQWPSSGGRMWASRRC